MSRFRIKVQLETYWDYVEEFSDEEAAEMNGFETFMDFIDEVCADASKVKPTIEVEKVPDDTPTGNTN